MHYIWVAGFWGVFVSGYIHIDHALITALVERWRPETHTFHFPIGEATITLQDVEVLWGLRIDGEPIIGKDKQRDPSEWLDLCERLLGFRPDLSALEGSRLNATSLCQALSAPLDDNASEEVYMQRARICIMLMLGGHLFSDKSGNKIPLMFLPLLRNLDLAGYYSWGSAALGYLYHNLCDAALSTSREISGFLALLQVWAWERLPTIRPELLNPETDFRFPYGGRWKNAFKLSNSPMHVLRAYRDQLTSLHYNQFIWQPYSDILDLIPPYCKDGSAIWRSVVYLVCWNIIEPHVPNRVLRQFGFNQSIPVLMLEEFRPVHGLGRRGRTNTNWATKYKYYVQVWNDRTNRIVGDDLIGDTTFPSNEYITWYKSRTILHISYPTRDNRSEGFHGSGSVSEYMVDVVSQMYHMSLEHVTPGGQSDSVQFATQVRDLASTSLHTVGESHRLNVSHIQAPNVNPQWNVDPRMFQSQSRRFRRRPRRQVSDDIHQDGDMHTASLNFQTSVHGSQPSSSSTPSQYFHTNVHGSEPFPSSMHSPHFQTPTQSASRTFYMNVDDLDGDDEVDEEIQCDPSPTHLPDNPNVELRRTTRISKPSRCGTHGHLVGRR